MERFTIDFGDDKPSTCRENETVFRSMCRNQSGPVQHGCCGGGCGVCKMQILSGDYETVSKMSRAHISPEEESAGIVLLCCVEPRSDLKIKQVK